MTFWLCPSLWAGKRCFIVAGGPSLRGFDFTRLSGHRVIAINSSAFSVPDAPYMFFGDDRWGYENASRLTGFAGEIVTTSGGCGIRNARIMKKIAPPPAVMARPDSLSMRRTSLTAAINLAVHLGATSIVLLGADMQAAPDGRTHHHAPHRWPPVAGCWEQQMLDLENMATELAVLGIEVVNTSLSSRIGWWAKRSIDEFLPPSSALGQGTALELKNGLD